MHKQRDQRETTDHFGRDRATILGSGGIDSEGDEIEPIVIDHGGRHIGEVVASLMRAVYRQEVEDANC